MSKPTKLPKLNTEMASLYQAVFNTPNGKIVWEDIVGYLDPDDILVKGDSDATHVNIGKHQAYVYINQLLRIDTND